jgi:ribosomal protein S18 acetylase RimI-like enzyme
MAKTLIRPAQAADFPTLLEIDAVSFPAGIAYDALELAWYMSRDGAETLVLESDGTIAAFLIVELSPDRRSATIITIDVLEKFRRQGFATQLFERMEVMLKEHAVETCRLQVEVGNTAAIAFYTAHGFRTARRLRRYYPNGADAWLMVKTLPTAGAT